MEQVPVDVLFRLALELDLPELLLFCRSSKRINENVCRRNHIWNYKLNTEFSQQDREYFKRGRTPRQAYTLLYQLTQLQHKLPVLKNSLIDLYNLKKLDLFCNRLTSVPPELGRLSNLQLLSLYNNQLTTVPPELGNLANLQRLHLGNKLITIPSELGNLKPGVVIII